MPVWLILQGAQYYKCPYFELWRKVNIPALAFGQRSECEQERYLSHVLCSSNERRDIEFDDSSIFVSGTFRLFSLVAVEDSETFLWRVTYVG